MIWNYWNYSLKVTLSLLQIYLVMYVLGDVVERIQWGSASAIHRLQERLCFSSEGGFV
jgi:hypothetical protein